MADPLSFGQWLRQRRKSYDFSQEDLADRIGCAFETIRKIEAGRRKPSRQMAELIAKHLGVPAEQLPEFVQFARLGTTGEWLESSADGDGPSPATSARPRDSHRGNLPAERTSLVGRTREVERVSGLLLQPTTRLATLIGPPGIGKTRLGSRVVNNLTEQFEDGFFFVPLSQVSDPAAVAPTINRVLGVKEVANQPAVAALKAWLEDKEMLLFLDNFEQVISARLLISELIDCCPDVKILVTSRIALRIYGEQQFPVPPLPLPGPATGTCEELAQNEAVSLFVQRSQAVDPDFHLSEDNAQVVAQVCRRLDGLPLAIELAAAHSGVLSPAGILSRLTSKLDLLIEGGYDLPPRQRTLRAAIAWSYDLLDPCERALFTRMSVFAGGCTHEAIEQVCILPFASAVQADTGGMGSMGGVMALLDKSLLQRTDGGNGEPRFSMLDTIQEYAREMLQERSEQDRVPEQHARYFLALSEAAEPHLTSGGRDRWLARLDADLDNLRAALAWCLSHDSDVARHELGLRMAGALYWFWYFRGFLGEGRGWLEKALALAGPLRGTGMGAKALNAAGRLALLQDDYTSITPHLEESVAIWRRLGEKRRLAYALTDLGVATVYRTRSHAGNGHAQIAEAIALFREECDSWGLAYALDNMGDATILLGGSEEDVTRYREKSLALYQRLGDEWGVASQLSELGHTHLRQGNYEAAGEHLEQALAIQRRTGDKWSMGQSVRSLGDVAWYQQDYARARALYMESLLVCRDLGDKLRESFALRNLGHIALEMKNNEEAGTLYRQSLALVYSLGSEQNIALCLAALAEVAVLRGDFVRAARLLSKADALREASRGMLPPTDQLRYRRNLAAIEERLDPESFASAWEQGRRLTLGEAYLDVMEDEI